MQMSNTGKSYARYCGAWFQHELGMTLSDFTGLQVRPAFDCRFSKTATEYESKTGINWLSCAAE